MTLSLFPDREKPKHKVLKTGGEVLPVTEDPRAVLAAQMDDIAHLEGRLERLEATGNWSEIRAARRAVFDAWQRACPLAYVTWRKRKDAKE